MLTEDQIKGKIAELENEKATLEAQHNTTVQRYQQMIQQNQNRFQQLTGAITTLSQLLNQPNGKEPNG